MSSTSASDRLVVRCLLLSEAVPGVPVWSMEAHATRAVRLLAIHAKKQGAAARWPWLRLHEARRGWGGPAMATGDRAWCVTPFVGHTLEVALGEVAEVLM